MQVLLILAVEFEVNVTEIDLVKVIIKAILNAPDVETGKAFLERILEKREPAEKLVEQERERLERLAEREREFQLEKLRLSSVMQNTNLNSSYSALSRKVVKQINLKDLVPNFNPKELDFALFF